MAAIEYGIPYYLYDPGGVNYVVFTLLGDPQFVGYITDITGLDSPGVRENAQTVVAGDGGYHGPFWKDRRPWTMSGIIMPTMPVITRDQAQEKLEAIVMRCLQSDGSMIWTPSDGIQRLLRFRTQQPPRITKGQSNVERVFNIACVTADWRVLSNTTHTATANSASGYACTVVNAGNAEAAVSFDVTGPASTYIIITNNTTGKSIRWNGNVASGHHFQAQMLDVTYPAANVDGTDAYGSMDPLNTDWSIAASPGSNTFSFAVSSPNPAVTSMNVYWRDAWV